MLDPQANFDAYMTFGWRTNSSADGSSEPMSLVDTNIRAAIATEMQRKGYIEAPADSAADLLLDYEAARTEKMKSSPFRIGVGVGSYGSSGGAGVGTSTSGVKNVIEGSLVVPLAQLARDAAPPYLRIADWVDGMPFWGDGEKSINRAEQELANLEAHRPVLRATPAAERFPI